jgi:uncharacterized membrane protein HdeD (DUF308 family)
MTSYLSRNWWTLALRGLAAVIFGVLAFIWPGITITILVLFFGAYVLWDGIFALVSAFRTEGSRRWPLVLEGVVGIIVGLIAFLWTDVATLSLLLLIGAWAVITGIFEIIAAIRLREEIEGEWLMLISGVLSVLFGIALFLWPAAGALAVTWIIATYAILFGILLIVLGFRLRSRNEQRPMAA